MLFLDEWCTVLHGCRVFDIVVKGTVLCCFGFWLRIASWNYVLWIIIVVTISLKELSGIPLRELTGPMVRSF